VPARGVCDPATVAARNLVNLERVSKDFGKGAVLHEVSLGVGVGERIGVVGRNGGGKSTLLKVIEGVEQPDSGRVTRTSDLRLGWVRQAETLDPQRTVGEHVLGERAAHEWASQPAVREVLTELLGGFGPEVLDRVMGPLSGGERRRVELARCLIEPLDLLLLDEPTNHLDVEAVAWLAQHLVARRDVGVVVVTHDRWFLDAVTDRTWEVVDGSVEEYDGGYSAYVLAKSERTRQADAAARRRNNLLRKELAWLRRGPPARTSKPKFRIDAANELIEDEPPARDSAELLAFAGARLGRTVYELHDASVALGPRELLDRVTWNVGPGQRIGIVGVNGAGKTTLLRVLLGLQRLSSGRLVTGVTVKPAFLSQHLEELDPTWRVLEAVERVAQRVDLGKGRELTASQLCERLGFGSDAQWTPVGDLSGGERRRLQLTRLLMGGPNVLILDEPTNDFDVETLTALEDLLDSFAGTLLVVSHDRYFLERVCEGFVGLIGDGKVRDLPGEVEEYLALRRAAVSTSLASGAASSSVETLTSSAPSVIADDVPATGPTPAAPTPAERRAAQKDIARLERQIAKFEADEMWLHEQLADHATDYVKVAELNKRLADVVAQKELAEEQWLSAAAVLEP
jgi:ATP-binding cassette subfamily F protein uup